MCTVFTVFYYFEKQSFFMNVLSKKIKKKNIETEQEEKADTNRKLTH